MSAGPFESVGVTARDAVNRHRSRSFLSVTSIWARANIGGPTWWRPRGDVRTVTTADGIRGVEVRVGWLRVAVQVAVAGTGGRVR